MAIDRRLFLGGAASALATFPWSVSARAAGGAAYLAPLKDAKGFAVAGLDMAGNVLFRVLLPGRGHGVVAAPDHRRAIVLARRPDRFAVVVDLVTGQEATSFETPADRHFFGHGVITPDGRYLLTTENDFDGERGVCGVYDIADGFRRVDEYPSGGIGPHEMILLADGKTIAVANGGILTHPDFPRQKLNLASMSPSLSYIDLDSGRIEETVSLADAFHQVSIRHICSSGDQVWWAGQYEGAATDDVPLVGYHRRGEPMTTVDLGPDVTPRLRHYVGSIAANAANMQVAITSPRGGCLVTIDTATDNVHDVSAIRDVCGVAPRMPGYMVSAGTGAIALGPNDEPAATYHVAWDNHLYRV